MADLDFAAIDRQDRVNDREKNKTNNKKTKNKKQKKQSPFSTLSFVMMYYLSIPSQVIKTELSLTRQLSRNFLPEHKWRHAV